MKFLFVDEFKENKKENKFYGIVVICIDNNSYPKFKKGFYEKLKKLGWNPKIEIKGFYSFSSKRGDTKIPIEKRLNFVGELFELSKSGSGKYASAQIYYTFDIFDKKAEESNMYLNLLSRIVKKLPKGFSKNAKNNIVVFLDDNNAIDIKILSQEIENLLIERNLFLVERCISFCSGNETPGIIFVDYVAYFINNYFKTGLFNDNNKERIKFLINRLHEKKLTESERDELNNFIISMKKEHKSKSLLKGIKKMIYVK